MMCVSAVIQGVTRGYIRGSFLGGPEHCSVGMGGFLYVRAFVSRVHNAKSRCGLGLWRVWERARWGAR